MSSPEQQRNLELRFHEHISSAMEERWQREGRYSAQEILSDIQSNKEVWKAMLEQLATQAATKAIQLRMGKREPATDSTQDAFPFAEELPVRSIAYKKSVISITRATAEEFTWFANWYKRRYDGTVRRSTFDRKTSAQLDRLARIVKKYGGDDPAVSLRVILEARHAQLETLRRHRKQKRRATR